VLLTVDLLVRHTGENFINEECITIPTVLSLESSGVESAEFDTEPVDSVSVFALSRLMEYRIR